MKHFHCISVYGQEDCINGLKPPLTIKQQLQVSEQMSKAQAYCGYKNIFFLKFCVNRDFLDLGEKFLNTPEFIKYLPSEVGNFFFSNKRSSLYFADWMKKNPNPCVKSYM